MPERRSRARSRLPGTEALGGASPASAPADTIAPADLAACRRLLANGSRTFLAASYLLPRSVRDPACALYAFCRVADDAIDAAAAPHGGAGHMAFQLAGLRRRLDRIYDGRVGAEAALAPDRAFAAIVRRFALPRELAEALLDGFAWDAAGRRYEELDDLHDYAARVAGSVGAMMALVMGAGTPSALARACDLGVAMQLSNIARDVGEDARAGRVYLPIAWLRQAGVDVEAWLAAPVFDTRIGAVVGRLLGHAETLYAGVEAGIAELPRSCRVGIRAAARLYAEIGHEVARRGFDSLASRAVVSPRRKVVLLAQAATRFPAQAAASVSALNASPGPAGRVAAVRPPLPSARHLVDAAAASAAEQKRLARPAAGRTGHAGEAGAGRVVWLIDLFERLEREDRWRHATGAR